MSKSGIIFDSSGIIFDSSGIIFDSEGLFDKLSRAALYSTLRRLGLA